MLQVDQRHREVDRRRDRARVAVAEACATIAQDGAAYHHVCRDLKNDKDIVLAAVRLDGELLEHVPSFRLRDDADIVAAAVAQNGYALEHASAGVVRSGWRSNNLGIVVSAMEQRISAMQTVGAGNAKYAPSD